ncbi:unnamed protein product [Protopolystoma xenopodis]|uniref:Uncharacterized protein n=1 Tax=Protopolystoma xenopodis TaxID=117903 RepID=A0A3S5B002_9PLAT|nr:unnamed protein product [Protopolystoma xenopodis]
MFYSLHKEDFSRLLQEQKIAIEQTDENIRKFQKFKQEYNELKTKLNDVSKCFTKPYYAPFTKRAIVKSYLVHTNEVLVFLGGHGNNFAEVSTFEASHIIDMRINRLNSHLEQLKSQLALLKDRERVTLEISRGLTPTFNPEHKSNPDEVEIHEKYDSEAEIYWEAKHKEQKHREREIKARIGTPDISSDSDSIDGSSDSSSDPTSDESEFPSIHKTIYFTHSNILPQIRRDYPNPWTMTPGEAADACLKGPKSCEPSESLPISDIVEHHGSGFNYDSRNAAASSRSMQSFSCTSGNILKLHQHDQSAARFKLCMPTVTSFRRFRNEIARGRCENIDDKAQESRATICKRWRRLDC